jgi:hypothetical protein
MWVNTTATRPGARVIARWPAGVGLDTPSPSDFITVRDTNNNGSGREGGGGGGRGGRVILLNLYPPSQDAGNASGAIRTMWNASFTDMAPAFAACIFLAASPLPVLAEEQGDGEEDGEEAEVAIAFEDFDDVVDAIIHVINTQVSGNKCSPPPTPNSCFGAGVCGDGDEHMMGLYNRLPFTPGGALMELGRLRGLRKGL